MSDKKSFPEHVAIILDGNGRWARQRGRERTFGHQEGAANVKTIVRAAGHMDNVQVHIVGDVSVLSEGLRKEIAACERDTAANDGMVLNVAINYGGRMELVHSMKKIAEEVKAGRLDPADITEDTITSHLYPSDAKDVDLLIRTGGESRISNFLIWQISYSELYFTPVLWPDFTVEELQKAVDWFTGRDRRFGGLTEKDH